MNTANAFLETLLAGVATLALPLIVAALTRAISKAGTFLDSKTKSQKLRDGIDLVVHAAQQVVQSLEQTVRPSLATLPNGQLTPSAANAIKTQAVDALKNMVKANASSGTGVLLQMGEEGLNAYLGHLVESTVAKLPSSSTATPAVPQTPPAAK